MPVCEIDLRVGGRYRYRWRSAEGREFGSEGEHLEIEAPARLVTSECMEGFDGEAVNTLILTESAGRTTLSLTKKHATRTARDATLATGMTDGVEASYRRIDQIAAEAAA
jgi:uncharacterized protein YndB with AHSA1/START domain